VNYFAYRLIPPRPTFAADLSDTEAATMGEHVAYWQQHLEAGRVLIFGPVADPAGSWGLAVVAADDEDEVRTLGKSDPAVTSGMCTFEILAMPGALAGLPDKPIVERERLLTSPVVERRPLPHG
jgi:uncharacterized protein YciI